MENISISTILMENHILSIVGNWSQRTKKPCLSLRKLEKQVNTDLDLLVNIVDGQFLRGWFEGLE